MLLCTTSGSDQDRSQRWYTETDSGDIAENILQLGTCVRHKVDKAQQLRATSAGDEELLSEHDGEKTIEDTPPEPDSISRSSRAGRPPARYDPSI